MYFIINSPLFVFFGIAIKVLKNKEWHFKIANSLCLFIVLFFQYNFIKITAASLSDISRVHWLIWPPLVAAICGITLKYSGRNFTKVLTTTGAVLLLLPFANIGAHLFQISGEQIEAVANDSLDLENITLKRKPNIYHIILDAYAREDLLNDEFDYDNSSFLNFLSQKKFKVLEDSYSNYISTHISIPSTLQMNYPFIAGDKIPSGKLKLFNVTQGKNRFVNFIKRAGYRYVHFQNGYYDGGLCRGTEDVCIYSQKPRPLRDTERSFLTLTPILFVLDKIFFKTAKFKSGVNEIRRWKEQDLKSRNTQPTYLYAHILNPHPPYLFQPDCSHRENAHEGMRDYSPEKYLTQVKCLSREVEQLVESILKDKSNPIVVIHADHGPYFGQSPLEANKKIPFKALRRRFAILNAFHIPFESCRKHLYDRMSPINTLRLIVSCLQDTPPNLLQDRHYLPKGEEGETDHGYELQEVLIKEN
jgi:hypothetical protein